MPPTTLSFFLRKEEREKAVGQVPGSVCYSFSPQGLSNLMLCIVMRGGQGRFHHADLIEEKTEAESEQHRMGRGRMHA